MEPTEAESSSRRVCELLVYVLSKLNRPIPTWVAATALKVYGEPRKLNQAVRMLCAACRSMTKKQQSEIIYDGRNKRARRLADWWEEHQEADKERMVEDHDKSLREQALAKLTPAERRALFRGTI